jgi:hypothetical protein
LQEIATSISAYSKKIDILLSNMVAAATTTTAINTNTTMCKHYKNFPRIFDTFVCELFSYMFPL